MRDGPPSARRRSGALLLALAVAATALLAGCGSDQATTAEDAKARKLQDRLTALDIGVETDTLVSLYGDDGGKVCALAEDPGAMEREGLIAHPRFALRKTEVDPEAIAYTKAVIEVYCPEQLANVEDYIEGLRVDDGS